MVGTGPARLGPPAPPASPQPDICPSAAALGEGRVWGFRPHHHPDRGDGEKWVTAALPSLLSRRAGPHFLLPRHCGSLTCVGLAPALDVSV